MQSTNTHVMNPQVCLQRIQTAVADQGLDATEQQIIVLFHRELKRLQQRHKGGGGRSQVGDAGSTTNPYRQALCNLLSKMNSPLAGEQPETAFLEEEYLSLQCMEILQHRQADPERAWKRELASEHSGNPPYLRLWKTCYAPVYACIRQHCGKSLLKAELDRKADEIMQDILVAVRENLRKEGYYIDVRVSTYAVAIAKNILRNECRKADRWESLEDLPGAKEPAYTPAEEEHPLLRATLDSFFQLHPKDKLIILAKHLLNMSHVEIGRTLVFQGENEDDGVNSSQQALNRALNRLKRLLRARLTY